jgi:hypothetical protein
MTQERGHEDVEVAERWECGHSQGHDTTSLARGSVEHSKVVVEWDHSARGGVTRGAREGGGDMVRASGVGHDEAVYGCVVQEI